MSDVLVAELVKNTRERLRVTLTEYHGRELLDLRAYYQDAGGEWKPGKGLTVRRELLPELRKALLAAERVAKAPPANQDEA